jgi:hypothetical protein
MQAFFILAAIWQGAQQCALARDSQLLRAKKFSVRKAATARLFKVGPGAILRLEKLAAWTKDSQAGKAGTCGCK